MAKSHNLIQLMLDSSSPGLRKNAKRAQAGNPPQWMAGIGQTISVVELQKYIMTSGLSEAQLSMARRALALLRTADVSGKGRVTAPLAGPGGNPFILEVEYVALKDTNHNPLKVRIPGQLDSLSDLYTPQFNEEQVYGRMDPIATYQGTGRKMDLAWESTIGSQAAQFGALFGDLIKMMYPVYQTRNYNQLGTGTMVAPPLLRFRLLNAADKNVGLIVSTLGGGGILGLVKSFSIGPWDTNTPGETNMAMQPTAKTPKGSILMPTGKVNLKFNITVMHQDGKVGWVWDDDGEGKVGVSFAQKHSYPYGYDTTLPLSDMEAYPSAPASSDGLTDSNTASDPALAALAAAGDAILD